MTELSLDSEPLGRVILQGCRVERHYSSFTATLSFLRGLQNRPRVFACYLMDPPAIFKLLFIAKFIFEIRILIDCNNTGSGQGLLKWMEKVPDGFLGGLAIVRQ